jgi:hypothetical protein
MTIVAERSWDDIFAGHLPENPACTAWRQAVTTMAERAKAALPECNGRVESAVKLVLAGDVELLPDGTATVASQSNGTAAYVVVNGTCECPDFPRAPHGFCKHRLAYGIHKRALTLVQQTLKAQEKAHQTHQSAPVTPQDGPESTIAPTDNPQVKAPLPEAPASVNVRLMLAGREVQVTLRDADEDRLLERLRRLLERFPATSQGQGQGEPEPSPTILCARHRVPMRQHRNARGSWWAHKTADGWCHGR